MSCVEGVEGDYLSKENADCLKGIMAALILGHHLYQHGGLFTGTILASLFQFFGYACVSVFFFLSGYGLALQYRRFGKKYIMKFIRNRIIPYYLIYVLVAIIYFVYEYTVLGWNYHAGDIFQTLFWGNTVVINGWYLQTQLLLYFLFFSFSAYLGS